jgi:AcrR family transcriptional regulator
MAPAAPTDVRAVAVAADEVDVARRGRPRSKEREREILAAALHALVNEGFDAMTIEGVAAAAGAGKATVYRRWHNKVDLVIDAIREQVASTAAIVDTGDIAADMRSFLTQLQCDLLGPNGALLATFMAERLRHPALAEAFESQYKSQKRAQLRRLVRRAVTRGDLPADSDIDLLAGVGPALMIYEFAQRGGRLPRDLPDRIVRQFFE